MNGNTTDIISIEIRIAGIVQGVGFRPFVYNMAESMKIKGWVNNAGADVVIAAEGEQKVLDTFVDRLKNEAPPLSRIKEISTKVREFTGYKDFKIIESTKIAEQKIYISPDVSICSDCSRELLDSKDRRYLYPFINCTNCGPRFTIIKDIPYDRVNTTMHKFLMCERCGEEYRNPADRRYHAQPVACHDCGPKLQLVGRDGRRVETGNIVAYTIKLLLEGKIIAIKGLGGYHLACDALNANAVTELRQRKIRDDKPFALMVKDCEIASKYCFINDTEKKLLASERKPIVLLRKKDGIELPEEIAPGRNPNLGIMLPYTPVHCLLFELSSEPSTAPVEEGHKRLDALVMTSGNRSSEPIYYKDEEALENLKGIADYFLTNDREIYIRTDDSVTRTFRDKEYIIRRSRGYVPMPVTCDIGTEKIPSVLACGGELKNTFCLNKGNEFYLSHHIGDLENAETLDSFEEGIEHFKRMFSITVDAVAYDLHPEYLSTKYALDLDIKKKIPVQHHHAHVASVMAENNLSEDVIGIAFDGTGYGEDGHIWGGEIFTGSYQGFKRAAHLEYVKMPGGGLAIKEPWRMAVSYLYKKGFNLKDCLGKASGIRLNGLNILSDVEQSKIAAVLQMLDKSINSPLTSSMGRLFDAVSALIGIRSRIHYEGQAAIELEYITEKNCRDTYPFDLLEKSGGWVIHTDRLIESILEDMMNNRSPGTISIKFHNTVADIVLQCCMRIRSTTGLNKAVLSGGVFQNITLLDKCINLLEEEKFEVFTHSIIPSNDGGISLGQAAIAASKLIGG